MKPGEGEKNNILNDNLLVLSIDNEGKIVFLNKELEKQVGYYKNEVINKKSLDLFLPENQRGQWNNILNKAKNEDVLTDFELPLINKKGKKIMASWDIAPVNDTNLGSIGFVGRAINKDTKESNGLDESDKMSFRFGNKKIFFKKPFSSSKSKNKDIKKKEKQSKKLPDSESNKDNQPPLEQYNPEKLRKNVDALDKKMQYLEVIEQENIELKKKLQATKTELSKTKDKLKHLEEKQSSLIKNSQNLVKNSVDFIFDVVGGKKKKEEFEKMMNELDERRKKLKNLEENLSEEKIRLNDSVDEFVEWREKLENLENEVEKRREFLVNREQNVKDNILSYVDEGVNNKSKPSSTKGETGDKDPSELIDDLDSAAVILQRGILKHANNQFLDIIGLSADKIINKSFFDFISSDGLSSFEKYYLDRLKGETSDFYDTVILTSDKNELSVKVDIKPVLHNGTLVDKLVVIDGSEKSVKKPKGSSDDSAKLSQDKINKMMQEKRGETTDSDAKDDSDSSSDVGSKGKMNQDEISEMFAKERGEKTEDKSKKKPVGGVPGVVTQDQIDNMVKNAKKQQTGSKTEKKETPTKKESKNSDSSADSNTGKMSQDEINAMMNKARDDSKKNDGSDNSDDSNSSGGKMSQDEINAMMNKTRSEKKENKK